MPATMSTDAAGRLAFGRNDTRFGRMKPSTASGGSVVVVDDVVLLGETVVLEPTGTVVEVVGLDVVVVGGTRVVVVVGIVWTRTKTSLTPFVSPGTRFVAALSKMITLPSSDMAASKLLPLACAPAASTLTRSVRPVPRSRTNSSAKPFVSPD